ncbi:MAG: OadG family protein [Clostridia bacterium]|nr:OadG family protein [Clostridia bacterium]
MSLMESLAYGAKTAVIGIAIVFFGLVILIVVVSLMAQFFKMRQQKAAPAPAPAPVAPAPVAEPEPVVEDVTDDTELIAVIAAALAAYDNSGNGLVIRKVRRVSGWNRTARAEQVTRF